MSGARGDVPPVRRWCYMPPVRRWCEDCQDFTASVMVDGQEECENHPYGFEDED